MSKSNKTYIITPEYGLDAKGKPTDLVAEVWQDDGRWAVGERHPNGDVNYRHRTFDSLGALACDFRTTPDKLRRQTKRIEAERAAKAAVPSPTGFGDWRVINNIEIAEGMALVATVERAPNASANARLISAAPELHRMLTRLAEKVRRANAIQHSGGVITAEDWSELFALQNEAFGVIARAEGRAS